VADLGTERAIALLGGELGRSRSERPLVAERGTERGSHCLVVNLDDSD